MTTEDAAHAMALDMIRGISPMHTYRQQPTESVRTGLPV